MAEAIAKIGIISCSGEEIPEGTVARQAVRRVLEALRPQQTVTLCLPLFLAGEEGERRFAKDHPTITIDGCAKLCAKKGTEKYSGQVGASLVVLDILGERAAGCHRSLRDADQADEQAIWIVAERIASGVDSLFALSKCSEVSASEDTNAACCSCGVPTQEGKLDVGGVAVTINGLPLIFDHLMKKGLVPDDACGDMLLETVRIYHPIGCNEEAVYRESLCMAYRTYCRKQPKNSSSS